MIGFTLNKEPLPAIITYEWLMANGACEQAEVFKELYPEGTKITEDSLDTLLEKGIDLEFLIGAAYGIYAEVLQPSLHRKTKHAFKSYEEQLELLDTLYTNASKEFMRARVMAVCDIAQNENLIPIQGVQYRLNF